MELRPLSEFSEWTIEANRARYREELAYGIYSLMVHQKVNRTKLAELMGYESKSRVTHILSGEKNLQADTLADVLLVLGRTPHLVMANDFDEVRFPVDEVLEKPARSVYCKVLEIQPEIRGAYGQAKVEGGGNNSWYRFGTGSIHYPSREGEVQARSGATRDQFDTDEANTWIDAADMVRQH